MLLIGCGKEKNKIKTLIYYAKCTWHPLVVSQSSTHTLLHLNDINETQKAQSQVEASSCRGKAPNSPATRVWQL